MPDVVATIPLVAHPSVPLLAAALLVAVGPRRVASVAIVAAPLTSIVLLVNGRDRHGGVIELYGMALAPLRMDPLAVVFAGAFAVAALLSGLYGLRTTSRVERAAGMSTAAAAIGVAVAGDLFTLFVWWELKAVASAVVVLAARSGASASAGLRYLYVHLIGGAVLLAGVAWHVTDTGNASFDALEVSSATAMIAAGFLVSAAAVPLHAWLPDAYPSATVTGTVLLSAFTTKAAVYALARGFPGTEALVWIGVAMALYGVVFAMLQDDLRRLLSYHIVSQVGFMIAAVGVGTEAAINGATAHAAAHIVYKGLLLMGVGAVIHATGRQHASQLGGLAGVMPWALALYLVGALSISGVPLLSGFVSKELSIAALGDSGRDIVVILLKVASVGTLLSTLGKLPYATWIAAPPTGAEVPVLRRPAPTMYAAMGIAAAVCIALGVMPGLLWEQLPYENTYTPYYLGKVAESAQLLGVAVLGFWMLRRQLAPHPGIVLDVDWLYRRPTPTLATSPPGSAGRGGVVATLRERVDARNQAQTAGPGWRTRPTWWFGVVLTVAAVLVMVGSVWR